MVCMHTCWISLIWNEYETVQLGWIRKSIFYFAKNEINKKFNKISRIFKKFHNNNFAKFREISQINIEKFRNQSFVGHFFQFDLKCDPDLVHKSLPIFACTLVYCITFLWCPIWFETLPGSKNKLTCFAKFCAIFPLIPQPSSAKFQGNFVNNITILRISKIIFGCEILYHEISYPP
jgi:hypothetical protein